MNLRDLVYVLAVAKHGQFSKAAQMCNVSQPALSNQIKKLEHELGGELFYRHSAMVQLSELGAQIVPIAQQVVDAADQIRDVAATFRDPSTDQLRLGLTPTLAPFLTGYLAGLFERLYPKMRIAFVEETAENLRQMLLDRDLDIALAAQAGHLPPLGFTPIWVEPLLVAARAGHPLTNRASIRADTVARAQLMRTAYPMGFEIEKRLARPAACAARPRPQVDVSALRLETLCRHICDSDACTLVPGLAAEYFKGEGWPLSFVPFEGSADQVESTSY